MRSGSRPPPHPRSPKPGPGRGAKLGLGRYGRAPSRGAGWGRGIPGVRLAEPEVPENAAGAWTTLRPGRAATWSHGEAGSQGTRGHSPTPESGRASPRRAARVRGGGCRGAREEGARRGRGREKGRGGARGRAAGGEGEADTSGRAELFPRPAGRGGGRARRGRRAKQT